MRFRAALVVAAFAGGLLGACHRDSPDATTTTTMPAGSVPRGVSISPTSFDAGGMAQFWEHASAGNWVTWAGDWRELGDPHGAPSYTMGEAPKHGLVPVIVASVSSDVPGGGVALLEPLDAAARRRLTTTAGDFAATWQPRYLALGLEVDRLAESDPAGYAAYVELFASAADAVHAASPDTKVFPVFQLERTAGQRGGLFGGTDDPATNNWALLDDFPAADLIGISTYPFLVYHDPEDVPADHVARAREHTDRPLLVVESGWPAQLSAPGWDSTPEEQARAVDRLAVLADEAEVVGWVWSFLTDQEVPEPFEHLGLLDAAGVERPAWSTWRALE